MPETISLDLIDFGGVGRSSYSGIEDLAQSIEENGLIQPLVLAPKGERFELVAGRRRTTALRHLGVTEVVHGVTSEPGRYGYVLKSEVETSEYKNLLSEIAENLDREDVAWPDQMKLLKRAWDGFQLECGRTAQPLIPMRHFGRMIGVPYAELNYAVLLHNAYVEDPEKFSECTSIRGAYQVLLKENAQYINRMAATKSLTTKPLRQMPQAVAAVEAQSERSEGEAPRAGANVPLTSAFFNMDGLEFLEEAGANAFDHIVTDPDYGVSVERLEASVTHASDGVEQETVGDTLHMLNRFFHYAFASLKPNGFCVTFYDLDHHEKIQRFASDAGFSVQRWPIVWQKLDYRSNAAPAFNFCKNIEYALVCRKPGATLTSPQMSSVVTCASGSTVRELAHPFAKPYDLWKFIYRAIATPGQVVCDPFVGSGSAAIAAAQFGLRPTGAEINLDHYNTLLANLRRAYTKLLGDGTTFS